MTGANRGIGWETARQLLQQGYYVFLGSRSIPNSVDAISRLHELGFDNVELVQLDATDQESVEAARQAVGATTGTLDVLINNAGMSGGRPQGALEAPIDTYRAVFDLNLFGVVRVTQAFVDLLRNSSNPRIVNVSSSQGSLTLATYEASLYYSAKGAVYQPSKAALNMYTIDLAYELRDTAFQVNAVDPGFTATDFNNYRGTGSVEVAAARIARVVTRAPNGSTGMFISEEHDPEAVGFPGRSKVAQRQLVHRRRPSRASRPVPRYHIFMRSASAQGAMTAGGERVLILSAGVGSGHNSAAAAVQQACAGRPDIDEVRVLDVLDASSGLYRDLLGKGYFVLVEDLPWLVDWGYDVSDQPFRRRGPIDPWTRANASPAISAIKQFRPTAIVCTHFLPAQLLASLILRGAIDAKTAVVTTDYDFQGLWLTSAFHALFVAREEGRVQLMALGLPPDRVAVTGIPIAPEPKQAPVRDREGLPKLLISAGASGGDYAVAVVRQTLHVRSPFTATILCGRNDALRQRIEQLVGSAGDRYRVLGFTSEMPKLLRESDLFVGKPGGLSASECMAAGLPMVLVNPIPGQEVRNGDYLMEQGAAIRCNTPSTIGWKIEQLLQEPGRLQRMQAAAQRIGRPNAAADVLTGLLDGPSRPLVVTRGAQKTILATSEQRLIASDLTGPTSLVRLVDPASESTVALLRAEELVDLQKRYAGPDGNLVLRHDETRVTFRWEARRLLRGVLRDDDSLPVRVEGLAAHPLAVDEDSPDA
ncbi:SDR family NAD(P)-dependent oxidoreductase [Glaciihabitans sp. UYNi722]|uniref:SDR family NAD(P)-dependent oxidoreductase n=1 Tax=Glaciihabitans sp. UYNi722 TaxID=3156344 RepID=UPI003398BB5F